MVIIPGKSVAQYQVSGIVEFTYENYESKVGGHRRSSYERFSQMYNVGLVTSIWDPRFLVLSGNVGYTKSDYSSGDNGSDMTHYGLNASFFSRSRVSLDLYGRKTMQTIQGQTSLAGYDVNTSSYGATLNLRLARWNRARNNNRNNNNNGNSGNFDNNNNNNNNGNNRWSLPLPDIRFIYDHNDLNSVNSINPLDQTRDNTKMAIQYRLRNTDLNFDGTYEQFTDKVLGSGYDTKTANFDSQTRFSSRADLGFTVRLTDRNTTNISGYNPHDSSAAFGARLDFSEKYRIRHYYRYDYTYQENVNAEYTTNSAKAGISYRMLDGLNLHGGLTYGVKEYQPKATATTPSYGYTQDDMGLFAGMSYVATLRPDYLDPFILNANYDFSLGYSKTSTLDQTSAQADGLNYTNTGGVGIVSSGWKTEELGANVTFSNRRDHSAAGNEFMQRSYSLSASTKRVPKTNLRALLSYNINERMTKVTNIFVQQSNALTQYRSLVFHLDADYTPLPYLVFYAGSSRDLSASNSITLSTLNSQAMYARTLQTMYYGSATFNYQITRRLQYRAELREEYRIDDYYKTETQTHRINMYVDYRIRMITASLEYLLQEDIPSNSLSVIQQRYLAKISRPF